jgi:hypothetical protein
MQYYIKIDKGRWFINGKKINEATEDEQMFFNRFIEAIKNPSTHE